MHHGSEEFVKCCVLFKSSWYLFSQWSRSIQVPSVILLWCLGRCYDFCTEKVNKTSVQKVRSMSRFSAVFIFHVSYINLNIFTCCITFTRCKKFTIPNEIAPEGFYLFINYLCIYQPISHSICLSVYLSYLCNYLSIFCIYHTYQEAERCWRHAGVLRF